MASDGVRARTARAILLLLFFFLLFLFFFFFFPFSPSIDRRRSISPSIDYRWPKSTINGRFWWYRLVAGGPRTGNLKDWYVPPGTGGTDRYEKPWSGYTIDNQEFI
ncbi:hypothetical protein BHE74_00013052 [Ensete ventricosum]|nr:hypothetical protein BHE74_00013052 [Ensete ventricosum]